MYAQLTAPDQDTVRVLAWSPFIYGERVTVGALDAVIVVADKALLFKYEQVHISVTEYTIDCPLIIVVSVQDVALRDDDEQALVVDAEPVTFDTFQDEKLQYEFEHAFAPADQETVIEAGRVEEEVNAMDDGVLAVTRALDDKGRLFAAEHVQPSTTVKTYALFEATFDTSHCVTDLLFNPLHIVVPDDPFID